MSVWSPRRWMKVHTHLTESCILMQASDWTQLFPEPVLHPSYRMRQASLSWFPVGSSSLTTSQCSSERSGITSQERIHGSTCNWELAQRGTEPRKCSQGKWESVPFLVAMPRTSFLHYLLPSCCPLVVYLSGENGGINSRLWLFCSKSSHLGTESVRWW